MIKISWHISNETRAISSNLTFENVTKQLDAIETLNINLNHLKIIH